MTWDIALILSIDGLASSAVYLLAGLGLVLIFSVTRVIFVPFGDIAAFSALTLAALETKQVPATIALLGTLACLAVTFEIVSLLQRRHFSRIPNALIGWGLVPGAICGFAWLLAGREWPAIVNIGLTILLTMPMAPLLARLAIKPIANASVLVLLIASLVLHFLLSGLGLLFFGPEGVRTQSLVTGSVAVTEGFSVSYQVILMICAAAALSALFFIAFERTLVGKALRATAINRVGARLVGIRPEQASLVAYGAASLLAGFVGVLISPVTTIYYDSGLLVGLKAFVAAIIGGLASYPLTALGALAVGLVESFASFFSGAVKDIIVFSLLIPVLILRSTFSVHAEEEPEEDAA